MSSFFSVKSLLFLVYCSLLLFPWRTQASTVVELTAENWDDSTKGKAIWVKFCTTSCHHCKQMHIAWERLADEFAKDSNVVIGRVNCDKEEILCQRFHILGTPTLLYGNPHDLQEYAGDKDFVSLNAWAKEVLVPTCTPESVSFCTETEKMQLDKWMKLGLQDIEEMIQSVLDREEKVRIEFQSKVNHLQSRYDELQQHHALHTARIQRNITLLKSIQNFKNQSYR